MWHTVCDKLKTAAHNAADLTMETTMKKLALILTLLAAPAYADRPSTLPESTGICTGGGLVAGAALSGTGIGAGPAVVLVMLCAILMDEAGWHAAGNTHEGR